MQPGEPEGFDWSGYLLQDKCMAHSAQMTMDGCHVLCPDIGADKLWFFTLLPGGRIAPTSPRSHIKLPGGSGPRHLAAHPNGRWLYLICEISCSIVALSWELSSSSPAEEHTESPTVTEIGIAQLRHCWFLFHVGRPHCTARDPGVDSPLPVVRSVHGKLKNRKESNLPEEALSLSER